MMAGLVECARGDRLWQQSSERFRLRRAAAKGAPQGTGQDDRVHAENA